MLSLIGLFTIGVLTLRVGKNDTFVVISIQQFYMWVDVMCTRSYAFNVYSIHFRSRAI